MPQNALHFLPRASSGAASIAHPVDLLDPDLHRTGDPHAIWTTLRREAPVSWQRGRLGSGFWAVTKHDDIVAIAKRPAVFSSARGTWPEDPADTPGRRPLDSAAFMAEALQVLDPPKHLERRQSISKGLSIEGLRDKQPAIDAIVEEALAEALAVRELDVAAHVALTIPLRTLALILGVTYTDLRSLRRWTDAIDNLDEPAYNADVSPRARMLASAELMQYFTEQVERQRQTPRGGLIARLIELERAGTVTEKTMLDTCCLFAIAGQETVHNALSTGVHCFAEHGDQLASLRERPHLLDRAVEEILRWASPIVQFGRFVTEDTIVRGQPLKAGQRVVLFYASANRDEDVYADPFRFDIARSPNPHLAFGTGEHFCIGAHVARMQLSTFFSKLARRVSRIEPAGSAIRLRSAFNAGFVHLPIRLVA
jgi:cholest-4-en-3-one 26-monooxygenase